MQVALWSAAPRLGDVEANIATVVDGLEPEGLTVFPELFLTGYNIGDEVQALAFTEDDERLAPLRAACREAQAHLIVGAPYTDRRGITYNSAACVDDQGNVTWVHKRALPTFTMFQEGLFFASGSEQDVWTTRLGRIGVHICYDLYFPEFQKKQVLQGADLLVNLSASPSSSRRFFEALLPARAIENAAFCLYSNNVGAQDGLVFWGGAQGWSPRGILLGQVPPHEEGVARFAVDLDDLAAAREFRPTIRDSRIDDLELES